MLRSARRKHKARYLPRSHWKGIDNPMAEQQHSKQRERVAGESPSPRNELVAQLRLLTPQAFTEDRVDFVKLREFLGDEVDDRPERFSFTWARAARRRRDAPDPHERNAGSRYG